MDLKTFGLEKTQKNNKWLKKHYLQLLFNAYCNEINNNNKKSRYWVPLTDSLV